MRYKSGTYRKYKQKSRRMRNSVILASILILLAIAVTCTQQAVSAEEDTELIDINTADVMKLTKLPGIGLSKAQAIVDYREAHGSFESIEDLIKVKGIGAKTLNNIKQLITATGVVKKKMAVMKRQRSLVTTWAKIKTGQ